MKKYYQDKGNLEQIKNSLIYKISKNDNKDFDLLFLIDATGSMEPYIISAREETKNISKGLRKLYPERNFKYGYIFYRDPIDSPSDIHEVIDLTDNVNSIPEQISKINAKGGGDLPEDWAGAYKLVNERISWRDGEKVIIHLADAGAHGKLFTLSDKYPYEEGKLIQELEKCALKKINIFGFIIEDDSERTFNECAKIYRNKGGLFIVSDFCPPEMKTNMMNNMRMNHYMDMNKNIGMDNNNMNNMNMNNNMNNIINNMNMNNNKNDFHTFFLSSPPPKNNSNNIYQKLNNNNFYNNAMHSVDKILSYKNK